MAYYYLHSDNAPGRTTSFEYYPHYRNAITVYLGSDVHFDDSISLVQPAADDRNKVLYSRNYYRRITVRLESPFRKLGIAFEPLGINHFIEGHLGMLTPNAVNRFEQFDDEPVALAKAVFAAVPERRVALLDQYLESRYRGFNDPLMKRCVGEMIRTDGAAGVEELAALFGISRKTLLRSFRRHLGCSVEAYKALVRFRNAVNRYRACGGSTSFTELALDHRYYDQPAFINHFRRITGVSPRAFFRALYQYGSDDTYWTTR